MKYKQEEHQTKYDYTLWYGHINQFQPNLRKFYSVQSLIRHRVVATRYLTTHNGKDMSWSAYNSETLTCPEQGPLIKIEEVKE